jgi:hypothetical protein
MARDEALDIVCSLPLDIDLQLAAIAKDRRRRSKQRRALGSEARRDA